MHHRAAALSLWTRDFILAARVAGKGAARISLEHILPNILNTLVVQITIQFSLDRSIDGAAQDVQAMIAKTLKNLPPGIIPPSYQKTNPADQPIIYYGFTSDLMPASQLDEYAETFMAQRISMVAGVAQVNVKP